MPDASMQFRSTPEPNPTPMLYRCIRQWFRGCAAGFYATTEVHGLDNVPAPGMPTIRARHAVKALTCRWSMR